MTIWSNDSATVNSGFARANFLTGPPSYDPYNQLTYYIGYYSSLNTSFASGVGSTGSLKVLHPLGVGPTFLGGVVNGANHEIYFGSWLNTITVLDNDTKPVTTLSTTQPTGLFVYDPVAK